MQKGSLGGWGLGQMRNRSVWAWRRSGLRGLSKDHLFLGYHQNQRFLMPRDFQVRRKPVRPSQSSTTKLL